MAVHRNTLYITRTQILHPRASSPHASIGNEFIKHRGFTADRTINTGGETCVGVRLFESAEQVVSNSESYTGAVG